MSEMFRIEELVAALTAARSDRTDDPAALSVQELMELTGYGQVTTARLIRSLMTAGRVVCVRKPYTRIDGARTMIPAYKLIGGSDEDGGGADRVAEGVPAVGESVLGEKHQAGAGGERGVPGPG